MKKIKAMKYLKSLLILFLLSSVSWAQMPELNFPTDPTKAKIAKEQFAISVDAMSSKQYQRAANATQWLMKEAPELYDGLYINAYKAYENLAEGTADEATRDRFLDTMFVVYDKKEVIYGLTDREKNNKAYKYYKYWKDNKSRIADGMKAYEVIYETPEAIINNNIVSYMDMVRRYKAFGNAISSDQVFSIYTEVMDVIALKETSGEDPEKLQRYKEAVNGLLTMIMGDELNCDFINDKLAPPLDDDPNPKLARKVFSLLLGQGCSESPYFVKSAQIIQADEPTAGLAKVIAQKAYANGDFKQAEASYIEAMNLSKDNKEKAELQFALADIYLKEGKKDQARNAAKEAANIDPEQTQKAWSFIGNLYMSSFNDCAKKQSQVDDRAIFLAAYDAFQKAGDAKGMANAKAQFPTMSDIFTINKEEGESIRVGCWINVTTTLRTRPSN
mgnify:CR=1 FL=1